MTPNGKQIYRFADVEVDTAQGCVKRGESEVHLRQQSFQVLLYLLEQRARLVTKEELVGHIWKETAVTDDALVQCIGEIRRVLGDDPRSPRFIKTVPKVGYRFVGPIERPAQNGGTFAVATEEITTIELEYEEEHSSPIPPLTVIDVLPSAVVTQARHRKLALTSVGVVVLIIIVSCAIYLFHRARAAHTPEAEVSLPRVPGKRAVAVMYFENQSHNAELDWLREGLADMLISDLSRAKNLTVLGRQQLNSLLERVGHQHGENIRLETAHEVARRGNADTIVTGSFAKLGDKLRIDVQLYDASDYQLKGAESLIVDRPEQILAQTDLLALKLRARLGGATDEREQRSGIADVMTDNLEAYRYYSLALEKVQGFHNPEAIELFNKAIVLDPQFAMAYARIGYAYTVTWGYVDKGKPFLEKAFQLSHRLSEKDRFYIRAWYAIANFDYVKAIDAYRQLTNQYPLEVEAYERLGRLLGSEGRVEESIEVLKRGLLIDPDAKDLHNALGVAYSSLGKHSEAIAAHQRYVELAPNEPNAHDSLGMSHQWAGNYEQAKAEYQSALELNPHFEVAVVHLGNVYSQEGRYKEAIDQYRHYLELAPSDGERVRGLDDIARVCLKKGDLGEARSWAQKLLPYERYRFMAPLLLASEKRDWTRAERLMAAYANSTTFVTRGTRRPGRSTYYLQGRIALQKGQANEAIENFKQAIQQLPPSFDIDALEDCLANAYLELGQLDEAIAEYERILKLNPNYPLVHYHLAQAYEAKGQHDHAREEYKQFLQVWSAADVDIPELVSARKQLSALS